MKVIFAVCGALMGLAATAAYADIPDEVVVGGVFDITGWAEGEVGRTVAVQAVEDFNAYLEDLGAEWRMELKIEDSQALGPTAFDKVQTLYGSGGVDLLVGMAYSSHIQLSKGYVDSNNILVISHASQAANLAIKDSIFRLVPHDDNQALAVVGMIEDAGIEVLLPVTRNDPWGEGLRNSVTEKYNGTIAEGIQYSPDVNEFSTEVSIIDETIRELVAEYGADKVGVFYVGTDEFISMIQQMKFYTNVDDVRWFVTNTNAENQELLRDDVVEFVNSTMLTATKTKTAGTNHITQYVNMLINDTYGESVNPGLYSYAAYDSIWLLGYTILQTNSVDVADLVAALPLVAERMIGSTGPLRLTAEGDLLPTGYDILQVQNGEWNNIATFDPASGTVIHVNP